MYNGKEIRKVIKKAAEPAKKSNPFGKNVSQYGYRDDSPFKDSPSLKIFTQDGIIDMSNTGIPLMANGRFLPPYSGLHKFNEKIVNETPAFNHGGNTFKKSHAPFDFEERARINEITMNKGGWLDKYDEGGEHSIVNYLANKGQDYSKEGRAKLAQKLGVSNYDYSANKNLELLSKLKEANTQVPIKETKPAPYITTPIKPINKSYAGPDYSNLSPTAKATAEREYKKEPLVQKQMKKANQITDTRLLARKSEEANTIVQRNENLKVASEANKKGMFDKDFWTREHFAKATQATPDKFRLFPNDPNSFIDEYLNPGVIVGSMVKQMGSSPLRAKEEDSYMPYVSAAAMPVVTGMLGAGAKSLIDVPGSGLATTGAKYLGDKAIKKYGLKGFKKEIGPEAFNTALPVTAEQSAAIEYAKSIGQKADYIKSPKFMDDLRTKGYSPAKAEMLQKAEQAKLATEVNLEGKSLKYHTTYGSKEEASNALDMFNKMNIKPTSRVKYTAPQDAPLDQYISQGLDEIKGANRKVSLLKEKDPLYTSTGSPVKDFIKENINKKSFESNYMPIATAEENVLSKSNELVPRLYGEERRSIAKDISTTIDKFKKSPKGTPMMGAESLSDSSFPVVMAYSKKLIGQGHAEPVFLGFKPMNASGHLASTGVKPSTMVNQMNEEIAKFNTHLQGSAKLPNAFAKDGKIWLPSLGLKNTGGKKFAKEGFKYDPNKLKAAGRTESGLTREEHPSRFKTTSRSLPIQEENELPILSASTFSPYQYGGVFDYAQTGVTTGKTKTTNIQLAKYSSKPVIPSDPRHIPQSGVVVDKRTGELVYFGDKGEKGKFPVLTGKNPELNSNPYSIAKLDANKNLRNTPVGYYNLDKQSSYMAPEDIQEYKGMYRDMKPIPAYGVPAPNAKSLAFHRTYNDPTDPNVFKRRDKLYNCPPGSRWTTWGCVNAQEESYQALNKALPNKDTMMVVDSKDPKDMALWLEAQNRFNQKEDGGEFGYMKRGGISKTTKSIMPRNKTKKNIQSSINFLQLRNETLFGPSGRNIYDPTSKKEFGGWLDKYQ